jgi:outer membrane protein assembly factor BamB
MAKLGDRLFIGIGGHAVAIDRARGTELWRTRLKASSYVTVWLSGKKLFAGANGTLFCLDPSSGEILWQNGLKGLGLGIIGFPGSDEVLAQVALSAEQQSSSA